MAAEAAMELLNLKCEPGVSAARAHHCYQHPELDPCRPYPSRLSFTLTIASPPSHFRFSDALLISVSAPALRLFSRIEHGSAGSSGCLSTPITSTALLAAP
jgi:hypothetical protein